VSRDLGKKPNHHIEYIPSSTFHSSAIASFFLWILKNAPATQFERMKPYNGFILKFKTQIYPWDRSLWLEICGKKCVSQHLSGKRCLKN